MRSAIQRSRVEIVVMFLLGVTLMHVVPQSASAIDESRRKAAAASSIRVQPAPQDRRTREGGRRILPPNPRPAWKLGVRVDNLDTGVRITHVEPNSAAWRFGLEARDKIVSVNGFQVGYVSRVLYDLGRELNLRADSRGWVRLLAWNHRNGELVNLDVALDRQGAPSPPPRIRGFKGSVVVRQNIADGDRAAVIVQLLDITDRLKTPKLVAKDEVPYRGQTTVEFSLNFDPTAITTGKRYELRAHLTVNGRKTQESLPGSYIITKKSKDVRMIMKPIRFRGR